MRVRGAAIAAVSVALVVLLAVAVGAQAASSADVALKRSLASHVGMRNGPPGAIAVVQTGARRRTVTAGVADRATGAKIDPGDHTRIASVSKAFNGAVAPTLADVADELLDFPPGSQYHYSDTDNIVAALMIEAATGVSYERELSALVLDPLALRDTSMPEGYRMPTPYVHGYGGKDDDSELFNPTLAWASGGMVSTPLDRTKFVRAYSGGTLISGATRSAQLQFVPGESGPPGPGTNEAGLAIFPVQDALRRDVRPHREHRRYTSCIGASPDGSRSAVVQANIQIAPELGSGPVFRAQRHADELAVCAARSG